MAACLYWSFLITKSSVRSSCFFDFLVLSCRPSFVRRSWHDDVVCSSRGPFAYTPGVGSTSVRHCSSFPHWLASDTMIVAFWRPCTVNRLVSHHRCSPIRPFSVNICNATPSSSKLFPLRPSSKYVSFHNQAGIQLPAARCKDSYVTETEDKRIRNNVYISCRVLGYR